jgi:ABC-type glycerol-3-phosphate transport system permease component
MFKNPLGFPQSFGFSCYTDALKIMNIGEMFFNTITLSIGQTFVSMAVTCMAAYTLAKYDFKGNKAIYTTIIICSVIPTFGAEASMYKLMIDLDLRGKYIGMLILSAGAFGGTFLYLHSFFKEIPWSFAESAMIDGASDFRIFLQIMIPLAKNGILVFTIMTFMGRWNEYWTSFLYYNNHPTLAVGLRMLSDRVGQDISHSVFFAGTVLCIIPVMIFYALCSDKLMSNLNAGGIKG